ncbi:MAG: hypothetical protein AAFR53_14190 [Pseudomonadota bacterium]
MHKLWNLHPRVYRGPEGEGAGGGGQGGGEGTPEDTPSGTPQGGGEGDPPATKWWEEERFNDTREILTVKGLTIEDQGEVIAKLAASEKAAQAKLRANPADLISKPKADGDVSEWLKENGALLGIPEAADKYELAKPEDWPEDLAWNDALEQKARAAAYATGMSTAQLQAMVGVQAEAIMDLERAAAHELKEANDAMRSDLEKEWGDQINTRIDRARRAAGVIAERAGLGQDAVANLAGAMKSKVGDAGIMRMFDAIAGMMDDDKLVPGDGATALTTTPAEARAELAKMQSPDGEYYKAVAAKDQATIKRLKPRIEQLTKLAAQ